MSKKAEIKVEVTYTPGFEKRFTEACLKQFKNREKECLKQEDKKGVVA